MYRLLIIMRLELCDCSYKNGPSKTRAFMPIKSVTDITLIKSLHIIILIFKNVWFHLYDN